MGAERAQIAQADQRLRPPVARIFNDPGQRQMVAVDTAERGDAGEFDFTHACPGLADTLEQMAPYR